MAAGRVGTNVGVLKDVPVLVSHDGVAAFLQKPFNGTALFYGRREDRVTLDEVVKINIRG